ncbi:MULTISPECIES: LacI family DNA-binding transcriptional regulator [unclassified Curtobacterium]|uniref:LacI family DNA-binding transcriptional regulator n=1 Tax=unclassified Curtobacterium TaxID=257496 RepID=UPI000DA909C8|nr:MULTISPECIES: LacI family DNA-binding transcriptional regulator [unclassified Curtobacterium]PZE23200.1 LacI family transcriptional regulator [Curtobacterium sp. MCBD17_028]WIB63000.1 LacI family DNA-binding transcriptional regulator [Curtobacterium sp. MCBD17_040]WIB66848.1 LacI family DNA-binding transcriptional regulator [Curtobacterium sp. MCBD17_035]
MVNRREVTLADVAARTGVSVGTVSKVLNGRGQIAEETRQRVSAAATELGLTVRAPGRTVPGADRAVARPMRGLAGAPGSAGVAPGRSFLVGVLSTDAYGRFTIPILTGAEDTFGPGEVSMLLAESRGDPIRETHYVQTFLNQRVDGIVVTGRSSDPRPSITELLGVPAVYALSPSLDPDDVSIVPDDEAGAARAIDHLLGSGRRSIAVISGARRHTASSHRVESAKRAIAAAGATLASGDAMYGEWSERWGYEAATRLLGTQFDGVFCTSDQIARGVVDCLREAGIVVPTQVGVVGVDNWSVITDAARPSITSVDLNLREVGRQAADLLMRMIQGEQVTGGVRTADCFLVARQST